MFFKVRNVVKNATLKINDKTTLKDVFQRFFSKYSQFASILEKDKLIFTVMDRESKVLFEVESIEDIYPNAVLELKLPASTLSRISRINII